MISIKSRLKITAAFLALLLLAAALLPLAAEAAGTTITEYGGLTTGSWPWEITFGPDGALWFTAYHGNKIGRIDPSTHAVTEYGVTAGSAPWGITSGPDGALWFTEYMGNKIGRIDPATHAVNEYGGLTASSSPAGITLGLDEALWFTERNGDKIGRIDPSTHAVTEYGVTAGSQPTGITTGSDGELWFTEDNSNWIGRINPATHGVTEYGGLTAGSSPDGITYGPDGALWFTESNGNKIGRIDPATHAVTEYGGLTASSRPWEIITGGDGALWFTEANGNKIGRIDAATHGVTEYGGLTAGSTPAGITTGSDGALWFTEFNSNKIGRLSMVYPTWYLAEGTTDWGFSTYITIENPNTSAVHAAITYMTGTGNVAGGTLTLPAMSQTTVNPSEKLGSKDFSTRVTCTEGKGIAVDRTMSWTGPGAASGEGHSSVGVTSPSTTWYLPEGSSDWGFETWLLIQNPNASAASCRVTYMIEGSGPVTKTKTVPAHTRKTFNMADDIGAKDASIKVVSNIPVIPERAMYRNNRREGHDSIGTTTPAPNYYLAEGTTDWGFTTYVLVQNPNKSAANVTLTYMTTSGPKPQEPFSMPANSRKTIRVNDVAGMGATDFSTKVHGSKAIIAERAMYWDNGTGEACHDSIGMNAAHTTFYLPDGQSSNGRETWTLVQNPNSSPVLIGVTYLLAGGGTPIFFTDTIPANSRKTYNMKDKGVNGRAAVLVYSKTDGKNIMVERAMYWNSRGAGTDTIGGFEN